MEIIKIRPDKGRAKSILKMVDLLEKRIKLQDKKSMSALILVDYYEIIKEISTGIMHAEGFKTLSHKDLLEYVSRNLNQKEISILDDLRVLRNRISYDGFETDPSYLSRNEESFRKIIIKLKEILKEKVQ
jgi:hypothetical protein